MSGPRYQHTIDLEKDTAHTRVIRLVGEQARVLDLGCATGYLGRVLRERLGCTVVGIEVDREAAATAAGAGYARVVVGDLETLDYTAELGSERFDVIVCADVLEHLRDPARVLATLRPFLAADGQLVASIPNVAHVAVIAELLRGRFPYRPWGLLDETHVRFFTRDGIFACFEQAGYAIGHLERLRVEPGATEFQTDLSGLPPDLVALLHAHEDSTTYQFVLTARPAPGPGADAGAPREAETPAEETAAPDPVTAGPVAARDAGARGPGDAATRSARLQAAFEALRGRLAFVEDARQREVKDLTAARDHWRRELEAVTRERDHWRDETVRLRHHLLTIQSGAGWVLLEKGRRLRLALAPPNSARERLFKTGLSLVRRPRGGRAASPVGLTTRLAFRRRRLRDLSRIAYTVYATQGPAQLLRKSAAYVRKRLTGQAALRPADTLTPAQLAAWFVRHQRPVAIVIPTYRQTALVRQCVDSIRQALGAAAQPLVRIIVVDDGSAPEVQDDLRRLPAETVLRPENEGFARTVNAGLARTTTEDVVILNNDTIAHPAWLEALQYCAYREATTGILGAKLLYPDGRIQSAGSYRSAAEPAWFDHCYRFTPADHPPANVQREVLAVTGACMYVKREVLDKIGPLDPGFAMAYEDVDYCLRAREAGFDVVYCPHATLTHLEGHTRGERQEPRELRSQAYFWEKWGRHFDGRRVWQDSPDALSVIYVLQDTGVAGGHRVVFEHLNGLAARGHHAELYSLGHAPKWFPLRVPVRTFPHYEALAEELAARDAVKVATWWETAGRVWKASLRHGVPVYLVQDIETSYYDHRGDTLLEQARVLASYRQEFHYLTDATWTRRELERLGLRATVVPPAIDHAIFKPLPVPRRGDVLLSVGRTHPLKNVGLLFEAYQRMATRPALHLFGVEREVGQHLGATYHFAPSDEEVARLYAGATAFVLTSVHEGYGLPILEAWAAGCPVVTTDADGNMDFCRDGENCLIVPKDDPARLARTLDRLLADPALQARLRAGGFETVRRYTWERAIDLLEAFYQGLARGGPVAPRS